MGCRASRSAGANEPPGQRQEEARWTDHYAIEGGRELAQRGTTASVRCTSRIDHRTYFLQFINEGDISRCSRCLRRLGKFGRAAEEQALAVAQMETKQSAYRRIVQDWGAHPSVVAGVPPTPHVWMGGAGPRSFWIVNELVPGSLDELCDRDREPRVQADIAAALFHRLVHCASRLHSVGVLHMDICPDNVRLRRPRDPTSAVLVDLGMCQPRTDHREDLLPGDELSETSIGHTAFMSLEQHMISVPHAADDIESIAYVALWVARAGQLPWDNAWPDLRVAAAKQQWIRQAITTTSLGAFENALARVACRCWRQGRLDGMALTLNSTLWPDLLRPA